MAEKEAAAVEVARWRAKIRMRMTTRAATASLLVLFWHPYLVGGEVGSVVVTTTMFVFMECSAATTVADTFVTSEVVFYVP